MDIVNACVRALVLYALGEAQLGHATRIRVTAEGSRFGMADNGRGHPLDKALEGTPYLHFIYRHFEYPFEGGQAAPVQLQGIGMSLVNALCSELTLTVTKRDERLEARFAEGRLVESTRHAAVADETGIAVSGCLRAGLQAGPADTAALEAWLHTVLQAHPGIEFFLNGHRIEPMARPLLS